MELLRKIYKMIQRYWAQRSSEAYLSYLRKSGFKIGDNTYLQSPKTFRIDITIGNKKQPMQRDKYWCL